MRPPDNYDVIVIGAGPAGLAAATASAEAGARTLIIEREERAGGILKQCIHEGFGLIAFGEQLTGPEYARRWVKKVEDRAVPLLLSTFMDGIHLTDRGYEADLRNADRGRFAVSASATVFATGCRERTDRQIFIHGTRPAGVFTAGEAQYLVNIQGFMPTKRCVILGSGDIGLIMARRLTLEGAEVEGVYEILPEPSGLPRNVAQCLEDFGIPLHLRTTVTRIHGKHRLEGVTVRDSSGTTRFVPCDALILSVGLIPETEAIEDLGADMDPATGGAVVDPDLMTGLPGLFTCGNGLQVYDLVDHVSASGETAGRSAASFASGTHQSRGTVPLIPGTSIRSAVPQRLPTVPANPRARTRVFFRSSRRCDRCRVLVRSGDRILGNHRFRALRPAEMEYIDLTFEGSINEPAQITVEENTP